MDRSRHILVVDDDLEIRDLLTRYLKKNHYRVTAVRDGREMNRSLSDLNVDLIVLDLMLPGEDGLTLCRNLRATSDVPIIMLTAKGEDADRIVGLELGADDYLPKPFNPRELLARINAVLRRDDRLPHHGLASASAVARFDRWTIDIKKRRLVSPDGVLVELSTGEFELLVAFIEHPKQVLSRDQLLDLAKKRAAVPFDRGIDVQVGRLRRKIEADPANPQLIKTVRNGGYVFTPEVELK